VNPCRSFSWQVQRPDARRRENRHSLGRARRSRDNSAERILRAPLCFRSHRGGFICGPAVWRFRPVSPDEHAESGRFGKGDMRSSPPGRSGTRSRNPFVILRRIWSPHELNLLQLADHRRCSPSASHLFFWPPAARAFAFSRMWRKRRYAPCHSIRRRDIHAILPLAKNRTASRVAEILAALGPLPLCARKSL